MVTPTLQPYAFADSNPASGTLSSALTLFVAGTFVRPDIFAREFALGPALSPKTPFSLFWLANPAVLSGSASGLPLEGTFRSGASDDGAAPLTQLAFFRTSFNDSAAAYVAIKSGTSPLDASVTKMSTHCHLDVGSIVLEAGGQAWFLELGGESYSAGGYFGATRFTNFYRTRTEGHNTLAIATSRQQPLAFANQAFRASNPQTTFFTSATWSFSVIDLTQSYAYAGVTSARRGVAFIKAAPAAGATLPSVTVLVQDEVAAAGPVDVASMFHTAAGIAIDASRTVATLSRGGASLVGTVTGGAVWEVISANGTAVNAAAMSNTGVNNLIARPAAMAAAVNISVKWQLAGSANPAGSLLGALSAWPLSV
jgi:hypothetical protein